MGNQDPFLNLCAHLFFLLFFISGFVSSQHQWDGIIVTQSDYQTLSSIKHELTDYTGILRTWSGTPNTTCSGTWAGILCSKGRITAIQVPFKGLGGRISPKIGQLRGLRRLSLHDNFITGTIPSSIRFLTNLRGLYLFNNRFSGSVPNSIGYLPYVQAIDISHNFLTGSIPSSLANSTRIYRLNLSHNSFSGPIPVSFTRAPSLTFLALEHNNLSGSIPDTWADQTGEVGSNQYRDYQLQSLSLDYNSFSGNIPPSLSQLASLKILSLSHNDINGSVPASFGNLSSLVTLNLENNHLDDEIPASLGGLRNLSVLSLRRNGFNGGIPLSIGNLSGITTLDLSENNLTGRIPASLASLSNLTSFNVSYNNLSGEVPSRLSEKFNSSSFVGNLQLCGFSSSTPCPSSPPPVQGPSPPSSSQPQQVSKHHKRRLSTKDIILILVGISLFILLLVCCVLLCCLIRKRSALRSKNSKGRGGVAAAAGGAQKGTSAAAAEGGAVSGSNGGKLVLFDGPLVFTADDLLCATAEIMGKSAYGTVYKASLEDGTQVAVKRLREKLAKSPKEFETEVASLGRIRHPNLLAMRAYYLGPKGEKLLVFDYMSKGSLSSFIHARGPETTVDWPTRMTIAVGIAHGLQHLHVQENVIHGNLTSSEIYLDEQTNPKISDYGISRLMTDAANTNVIATASSTGYRAPELPKQKKATTKTDIYSLGVIMLELLTGKTPGEAIDGSDLPHWVASTVKEEWTNEVFDLELMKNVSATGDEMLNTLKLALHLVDPSPDARPDIQQVIQQLEEINPKLAAVTATSTDDGGESHH